MRIALTQRNRRTPQADIVTTRVRGMLRASVVVFEARKIVAVSSTPATDSNRAESDSSRFTLGIATSGPALCRCLKRATGTGPTGDCRCGEAIATACQAVVAKCHRAG